MAGSDDSALVRSILVTLACTLLGSCQPDTRAEQCLSQYPHPTDAQLAGDTRSIPSAEALPLYRPPDALPQIYSADSSAAWFRNLFYVHLDAFLGGEPAVRRFLLRFQARIVGRAELPGWHAVLIPDPGPDTARFSLLLFCLGVSHGVYVRSVFSRRPPFLTGDTVSP